MCVRPATTRPATTRPALPGVAEARLASVEKRRDPFADVIGGPLPRGELHVGVPPGPERVDDCLGGADGLWRAPCDRPGELERARLETGIRDDLVDQAEGERLAGTDKVGREEQVLGASRPDQPSQPR